MQEYQLLVSVMAVGGKDIHIDFRLEDFVNHTMFLRNLTAPLSAAIALQRLWMASACLGMLLQLLDKCICFLVRCWLRALQLPKVLNGPWRIDNLVHQPTLFRKASKDSSGNISIPSPRRICSLASSTRAKNSSLLRRVGSASFSDTSLRRYLAARLSRPSSSAMAPRL